MQIKKPHRANPKRTLEAFRLVPGLTMQISESGQVKIKSILRRFCLLFGLTMQISESHQINIRSSLRPFSVVFALITQIAKFGRVGCSAAAGAVRSVSALLKAAESNRVDLKRGHKALHLAGGLLTRIREPNRVNLKGISTALLLPSVLIILLPLLLSSLAVVAQDAESVENSPPAPPTEVKASDTPNDDGSSLTVRWMKSADDGAGDNDVIGYQVLRSRVPDSGYERVASAIAGEEQYVDSVRTGAAYYYKVTADDGEFKSDSEASPPATATAQWFHHGRTNMLVLLTVFSGFVLWFISRAKRGEELYIRPIAGLQALDEAVGRATEMGKPVLFVPGILDMDQIETIAGLSVLGRVAGKTAQYGAPLMVPTRYPLVMTAARETVREAYLAAGRPDAYDEDRIWYLTSEQFGYAAGVNGIMIREKPGAIFYMGAFYAESLVLAETGHQTGAIQIAGTARPAQLPFFVTACDYTLIGEELFAASAYLSKQSTSLGSLKGQDYGKAVFMGLIALGVILTSFGVTWLVRILTVG